AGDRRGVPGEDIILWCGYMPLVSIWHRELFGISRGCHVDPAQPTTLDSSLHQARCLGLFDELADIGEPSGLAFWNRHRHAVGPIAVLQYPGAGQPSGVRLKCITH